MNPGEFTSGEGERSGTREDMRLSLIDLLIFIGFAGASSAFGLRLAHDLSPRIPALVTLAASWFLGLAAYLAVVCPLYRRCRWKPMLLPRCPCCKKGQEGFHFTPAWPRVIYRCPTCNGEFVIWHNGAVTGDETWDKPVLALKWPYVYGRYKRMEKPEQPTPPYSETAARSPQG